MRQNRFWGFPGGGGLEPTAQTLSTALKRGRFDPKSVGSGRFGQIPGRTCQQRSSAARMCTVPSPGPSPPQFRDDGGARCAMTGDGASSPPPTPGLATPAPPFRSLRSGIGAGAITARRRFAGDGPSTPRQSPGPSLSPPDPAPSVSGLRSDSGAGLIRATPAHLLEGCWRGDGLSCVLAGLSAVDCCSDQGAEAPSAWLSRENRADEPIRTQIQPGDIALRVRRDAVPCVQRCVRAPVAVVGPGGPASES